jgi:Mn-dependent DtxR family transcriptional regulator
MTTGYKTLTPIQLGNLLHALAVRQLPWLAARVWLACVELVAIREAAKRVRRLRRDRRVVQSEFQRSELETLTGLNARSVAQALGRLQRIGLVEFKATAITLADPPMPEAGETIRDLAGGRSARRPVPVPRTVLRFLAAQESAALGRVMLGYVCRGLSIDRVGGALREAGTVKASWLAETLGLSVRSVRYAQAELREMGWIGKDVGSKQWKLNRHGAWFRINLNWRLPSRESEGAACDATNRVRFARPTPDFCTSIAPPKEDRKTPSESKNQKPGVFGTGIGKERPACPKPLPAPTLANIRLSDLHDRERLRSLRRQAVERGWLPNCEADALNFFAAAVRARSTPARDPVRVFVALIRGRRWGHVTQAQENEARRMLQPQRGDGGASSVVPGPVRGILDGLVAALIGHTTVHRLTRECSATTPSTNDSTQSHSIAVERDQCI